MTNTALAEHQRRTFALISHPDAGKTTLTEKLLLGGGAIHIAGEVKARGARRHAHSDWMEMERKRGISITSSVMTFEHRGITFNLLDTPGHQDFSEDTYRTLSAVDSAIMVLDAAKGIEAQTRKLFEVCRMRDIPIMTFINKMDRETQDPFDLLNEIEKSLALDACPVTWPVGNSHDFRGCYHLAHNQFMPFRSDKNHQVAQIVQVTGPNDPVLLHHMSEQQQKQLCDDIELLKEVGKPFDFKSYREGHLTPVYFGSALSNYGVNNLLEGLYDIAPPPGDQTSSLREIKPEDPAVTGFVFKIQANMDPQHRDRVAFIRLCSGVFQRGMKLKQVRTDKMFAVQNPVFFLARERSLTETAYPGDIIGIPNHGTLRIGDTLTEGENLHFKGIPSFAPEILRRVYLTDPMKAKNLRKGLEDLAEEGISQLFKPMMGADWIVGVVGQLQLEVLMARIETEYKVPVRFEAAGFDMARWIYSTDPAALHTFIDRNKSKIAEDIDGRPVFLAASSWELKYTEEKWPDVRFSATREQFD